MRGPKKAVQKQNNTVNRVRVTAYESLPNQNFTNSLSYLGR